jgi:hypothetical protein
MWQLPLRELTLDQTPLTSAETQQVSRLSALESLRLCNWLDRNDELDALSAVNGLAVSPSVTCLRLDGNNLGRVPGFPAVSQLLELDLKRNR